MGIGILNLSPKTGARFGNPGFWASAAALLIDLACPQTGHAFALAAKETIDLRGNSLATDSFDSADLNYSNNGFYPTNNFAKIKDNGDVCTDGALINTLNYYGYANIMGRVRTGLGTNTINVGLNGSVGDKYWVSGGHTGIQPGHASNDFNTVFGDVLLPQVNWLPASTSAYMNQSIDGITYQYAFLTSGDFYLSSLSDSLYIGTNAHVRLWIKSGVNLSGSDVIRISPQDATLTLYMDGASFSLSGCACIDNQSGRAERFSLFGTPNCTSISIAGNGNFYGGVYAPQADFILGGGGMDTLDFIGCSVTKSLALNAHWNFHYDENWERIGIWPPWITDQPQSQRVPIGSCPELKVGVQWVSNSSMQSGSNLQWRFNGVNISGATNANLVLTNVTPSQAGAYSVLVRNELGSLVSSNALLSVYNPAAAFFGAPQKLSDSRFQFNVSIQPGFRYAVEASTNLVDWVPVTTNTGSCLFADPEAAQFPRRYYRSVHLP